MRIDDVELRACPFCSSDDLILCCDTADMGSECANVFCDGCYAAGPTMYKEAVGVYYKICALHAWNCLGSLDTLLALFGVKSEGDSNG